MSSHLIDKALREINPNLDATDFRILARRARAYALHVGPTVGHFVNVPSGHRRRITRVMVDPGWLGHDSIHVCCARSYHGRGDGNFVLRDLVIAYTNLDGDYYPKTALIDTGETRIGRFSIFHHNIEVDYNDIEVRLPCKVWRVQS